MFYGRTGHTKILGKLIIICVIIFLMMSYENHQFLRIMNVFHFMFFQMVSCCELGYSIYMGCSAIHWRSLWTCWCLVVSVFFCLLFCKTICKHKAEVFPGGRTGPHHDFVPFHQTSPPKKKFPVNDSENSNPLLKTSPPPNTQSLREIKAW